MQHLRQNEARRRAAARSHGCTADHGRTDGRTDGNADRGADRNTDRNADADCDPDRSGDCSAYTCTDADRSADAETKDTDANRAAFPDGHAFPDGCTENKTSGDDPAVNVAADSVKAAGSVNTRKGSLDDNLRVSECDGDKGTVLLTLQTSFTKEKRHIGHSPIAFTAVEIA